MHVVVLIGKTIPSENEETDVHSMEKEIKENFGTAEVGAPSGHGEDIVKIIVSN